MSSRVAKVRMAMTESANVKWKYAENSQEVRYVAREIPLAAGQIVVERSRYDLLEDVYNLVSDMIDQCTECGGVDFGDDMVELECSTYAYIHMDCMEIHADHCDECREAWKDGI